MTKIISREESIKLGLKYFFTGEECKHGHIYERYTCNSVCIMCSTVRRKEWQKNNRKKIKQYCRKWHDKNPSYSKDYHKDNSEVRNKKARKWRKDNPEKAREWKNNNKERYKELKRKHSRTYRRTNHGKLGTICSNVLFRLSTGKLYKSKFYYLDYTTEEFLRYILVPFPQFNTLQEAYDAGYQIDHIVPIKLITTLNLDKELSFRIVMDLNNMRLILAQENSSKQDSINYPIVRETIEILQEKYSISIN